MRRLLALAALVAPATAFASPDLTYQCGGELGFTVRIETETGVAVFSGPFEAELTFEQDHWFNEAREVQFWDEEEPPQLFLGSEQFDCGFAPGGAGYAEPAPEATEATPAPVAKPYASVKGWEVSALFDGATFVSCGGASQQAAGLLKVDQAPWGWEITVPAPRTEGFEGGLVTIDGKPVDSQFGFTPESTAIVGISEGQLDALFNGTSLTTRINGEPETTWSLAGSGAMVGKVKECFQRQGVR
jgi:hypothetical protein